MCANPTVDDGAGGTDVSDPNYGRRVVFDFGTLANPTGSDIDLVITYEAFVLNNAGNVDGTLLDNSAEFTWDTGSVGPFGTTIEVVEPQLQITKTSDTVLVAPNDIVTFTLTIQHSGASSADAFDVLLTDEIPLEFTYVGGTLDCSTSTNAPDQPVEFVGPASPGVHNGVITAGWSVFEFDPTDVGVCTFDLQATNLGDDPVTNIADVAWESLEIDPAGPQGDNEYSTERDYDPGDPENINTYFASSNVPVSPLGGGTGGDPGCTGPNCGRLPAAGDRL